MGLFEGLAQELIKTTSPVGPTPTQKIGHAAQSIGQQLGAVAQPLVEQRISDIRTGQYALDPYRRTRAKQLGQAGVIPQAKGLTEKFEKRTNRINELNDLIKTADKETKKNLKEERKDLKKDIKNIRKQYNKVVPSKDELDKLYQTYAGTFGRTGVTAAGLTPEQQKIYDTKFKAYRDSNENEQATLVQKQAWTPAQKSYYDALEDIGASLMPGPVIAGRATAIKGNISNGLAALKNNPQLFDAFLGKWVNKYNKEQARIEGIENKSERAMEYIDLMLTMDELSKGVKAGDLAARMGGEIILDNSVGSWGYFYEGEAKKDTLAPLLGNIIKDQYEGKAVDFDKTAKDELKKIYNTVTEGIHKAGISPEKIKFGKAKKQLGELLLSPSGFANFGPRTFEEWQSPNPVQAKWKALYTRIFEKIPSWLDIQPYTEIPAAPTAYTGAPPPLGAGVEAVRSAVAPTATPTPPR